MFVEIKPGDRIQDYLKENTIAVVKFATKTCPPCKMLKPIFERIAGEDIMKNIIFIAADADEHPQASHYGVASVPTLLFFKGTEVLGQNVGFVPERPLYDFILKLESGEES